MDDPDLTELLWREDAHYLGVVDLIAASNAPPRTVRCNADWGVAQFRSAEGHPGRRPYAGTFIFDEVERLAIGRACALFGAEHANVQPLSGSIANLAAFRAVLRPGDTLLAMAMHGGGHLSHGHPKHLTSELYRVVAYTVDARTQQLDYENLRQLARRTRPRAIVAGYSSYPRAIDFAFFAEIAREVGAVLVADISHIAGLVAAGLHPNPCRHGALVTTSVEKTLRGTRGGIVLSSAELANGVDRAVFPGLQSSTGLAGLVSLAAALHDAAGEPFRQYQQRVVANASGLAAVLSHHGIPLVAGGTDTHQLLVHVGAVGLSGRDAEARLESIAILSNRNLIPFDPAPPFVASGLRLGTAAVTARGYDDDDMRELGEVLAAAFLAEEWDDARRGRLRARVRELVRRPRAEDTLRDLCLRSKRRAVL